MHPTAVVADDATLGREVSIGAYVVIGSGCAVGDRTCIHPHATLYPGVRVGVDCVIHSGAHLREGTRLGDRCLVSNGAVLGAPGFGYALAPDGRRVLIPHRCPVELGDEVHVGALSAIDASHPGQLRHGHPETRTRLGNGVKLDNLVQIGHGCELGDGCMVSAQVGLAGTTRAGRNVVFGGQAASAGHVQIGDHCMVGARAAVAQDLEPGSQVLGSPAMERRSWGRFVAARSRIPDLIRRVRRLEERLGLRGGEGEV